MSESKARVLSVISRSRRQWDGLVKTWKRNLQSAWDPNAENKSKNANTDSKSATEDKASKKEDVKKEEGEHIDWNDLVDEEERARELEEDRAKGELTAFDLKVDPVEDGRVSVDLCRKGNSFILQALAFAAINSLAALYFLYM